MYSYAVYLEAKTGNGSCIREVDWDTKIFDASENEIGRLDIVVTTSYKHSGLSRIKDDVDYLINEYAPGLDDTSREAVIASTKQIWERIDAAAALLNIKPGAPLVVDGKIDPGSLVVVHATSFMPGVHPDGSLSINSNITSGDSPNFRNTVHFALNHRVVGHIVTWEDKPYAVVAPFMNVVKQEGPPAVISEVDTYWTTNAYDPLRLPDATLVVPVDGEIVPLFSFEGNVTRYKTGNFTAQDEQMLLENIPDRQVNLDDATSPAAREIIFRQMAMENAVNATIRARGYTVEPGGEWGWENKLIANGKMVDDLAREVGCRARSHFNSEHWKLEGKTPKLEGVIAYYEAITGNGARMEDRDDYIRIYDRHDTSGKVYNEITKSDIATIEAEYQREGHSARVQEIIENLKIYASGLDLDAKTRLAVEGFAEKSLARINRVFESFELDPEFIPEEHFLVHGPGF